ncbi:hypothetical protein [Ramlibacter sp. PS4R-6]|uniref:hypothetical protein n=1 Tax=Ramlibacter sp. PS4R-6 TaxID=3133438 RepID=UPI0030A6C70F
MEPSKPDKPSRGSTLLPTAAVTAVAVFAVVAAVMVKRGDDPVVAGGTAPAEVVTAPPLKAPDTRSMGGAAACKDCGVVQMVVAVNEPGGTAPRAYQMHIRMDDGSTRTIEQRGALAAGSRVQVKGSSVKPLS